MGSRLRSCWTHRSVPAAALNNSRGLTLLEVVLVATILGLLTVVVVPIFHNILGSVNIETAARQMASDIREAQSLAVRENSVWQVEFEAGSGEYRLMSLQGEVRPRSLHALIQVTEASFAGEPVLEFRPDSSPTAGGYIRLEDDRGRSRLITVQPVTGKVGIGGE